MTTRTAAQTRGGDSGPVRLSTGRPHVGSLTTHRPDGLAVTQPWQGSSEVTEPRTCREMAVIDG